MKNILKKSTLSLLLCLCMALTLLPAVAMAEGGTTTTTAVEDAIFNYAYDVQRSTTYPTKGQEIKMYNFNKPLDDSGTGTRMSDYNGSWTLTRVGAYSTIAGPSTNLTSVVNGMNGSYSVSSGAIMIHELKKARIMLPMV